VQQRKRGHKLLALPTHSRGYAKLGAGVAARGLPSVGKRSAGDQVERLAPAVHVYGHSHVNQAVQLGETCYVNNAFATPNETRIAVKRLQCIYDSENASVLPQLVQAAKRGLLWS
jgi:Icc-related predicted phosphoesterase